MTPELLLLALVGTPVVLFLGTSLSVTASWVLAQYAWPQEPMDPFQERLFLVHRRRPLWQRVATIALVESYWQAVALVLQARHRLRPFRHELMAGGGPPVILMGGYMENAGLMNPLARRLAAAGYQPVLLDFPSTFRGVEENAAFLLERVEAIRARAGAERVAFIGHSMSGVVARAAIHSQEDPPIAVAITLASPHRGTHMARLGAGASARDMRPRSACLRRFPAQRVRRVPIHTVVSREDNIVSPPWAAVLAEGDNLLLPEPVGHEAVIFMRRVHERILEWLATADFGATPAPQPAVLAVAER